MNKLEDNYSIVNPYRTGLLLDSEAGPPEEGRFAYLPPESPSPRTIGLAPFEAFGNAVKMGQAYYRGDEETFIDTAGRVAKAIDIALVGVTVIIQASSLAGTVIHELIHTSQNFQIFSVICKILTIPLGIVFALLSVIEAIHEGTNFIRCYTLMSQLTNIDLANEEVVVGNIKKLHKRFFSIPESKSSKITAYIEKQFHGLSQSEKAEKYDMIAGKQLAVKYADLARRISPSHAKEAAETLDAVIKGLQSEKQSERLQTLEKGRILLQTIHAQCKKKLLVHFVALAAIAIAMVTLVALFSGVGSIIFFALLTIAAILLTITHYALEKGLLPERGWTFSAEACIPSFVKTLLGFNSSKVGEKDLLESQSAH
ncbi:MAG: hypothetical protein K940chlam2_00098 [Chlamydiae bacterium]|nr:hypothetical protein [Chlamydiota bacterium]